MINGMQLPAIQLESETSDSIRKVMITTSICNYFKKPLNNNATKAINDVKAMLELHSAASDDVELNEMVIKKLADALKFSREFNTTYGYEGRDSAIKAVIALRLASRGAHLWLGHNSRDLISSVIQNWQERSDTQLDSALVLQYAQTLKNSQYAAQFQNDLQSYFDYIFINFRLWNDVSPDEIKLLAKMGANINECKYPVDPILYTPLMLCAGMHYLPLTAALIQAGAHLNTQDALGCTALHTAQLSAIIMRIPDTETTLKLLLDHGADLSLQNCHGNTIFDLVKDNPELRQLLLGYTIKKSKENIVTKLQNRALGKR